MTGLLVSRNISRAQSSWSLLSNSTVRALRPCDRASRYFSSTSSDSLACLSPPARAAFSHFWMRLSTVSRSLSCNSASMISLSRTGSTVPSTCTTLSSSKQRSTWMIASVSRMLARNLLPSPSPLLAPFTSPAISTISTVVGITPRSGLQRSPNLMSRSSGTVITPTLGSIVQNGKLADCALALLKQLKRVDLPTFGKPTIPHCKDIFIFLFNHLHIIFISLEKRLQNYCFFLRYAIFSCISRIILHKDLHICSFFRTFAG